MAESSGTVATDTAGIQDGVYTSVMLGQTGIPGGGGLTAARYTSASPSSLEAADNASQHFGDTFSIEFWLKLATAATAYNIFHGNADFNPEIAIDATGKIAIWSKGWAGIGTSAGAISDTTTFHHVVWTKATSTSHIYIDGAASDGTYSNQTISNLNIWFVGVANVGDIGTDLNGTLAMLSLYPTALTAATVLNHYNLGAGVVGAGPKAIFTEDGHANIALENGNFISTES